MGDYVGKYNFNISIAFNKSFSIEAENRPEAQEKINNELNKLNEKNLFKIFKGENWNFPDIKVEAFAPNASENNALALEVKDEFEDMFGKGSARVDGNSIHISKEVANILEQAIEQCEKDGKCIPISETEFYDNDVKDKVDIIVDD